MKPTCIALAVLLALVAGCRQKTDTTPPDTTEGASVYTDTCCDVLPARFATASNTNAGMVWIEGGEFSMGTNEKESYPPEQPAHRVRVNGFWIDETEVTNARFRQFVEATGYLTTAERVPVWEDLKKQLPPNTPEPPAEQLVAGGLVFTPPPGPVPLNNHAQWWRWVAGADWKHPTGPDSNIEGKDDHPVVQVSWDDAVAYAEWAGKRLPTEAEWEYACRGGLQGKRYAWGDEFKPEGKWMANTFQGKFPYHNSAEDGFERTAPVKSFPPNGYGLYDMIGNCWEWTADWFNARTYAGRGQNSTVLENPKGAGKPFDPREPYSLTRVTKGGSHLCTDHYCVNYRPSARIGTAFDSGMSHLSFRCVKDAAE